MNLFAQPPLRSDAEAITDQQHSDQQLRIDGRTAGVAVEICKMGTDAAQIDKPVDRPQEMILGNVILERELVEQSRLRFLPRSHHRQSLPTGRIGTASYTAIKEEFFNEISPLPNYVVLLCLV